MLRRGASDFTTGVTRYRDTAPGSKNPRIFVPIKLHGIPNTMLAAIDTGSPFSILSKEISEALVLVDLEGLPTKRISFRSEARGQLVRTNVTVLATEGKSLDLELPVLASRDWEEAFPILGYGGFIEHLQTGIDGPQNYFYFGP